MSKFGFPESESISRHRFARPGIRLWLPVVMFAMMVFCGWLAAPRIRLLEVVVLLFLLYVGISALVSVCEITVFP